MFNSLHHKNLLCLAVAGIYLGVAQRRRTATSVSLAACGEGLVSPATCGRGCFCKWSFSSAINMAGFISPLHCKALVSLAPCLPYVVETKEGGEGFVIPAEAGIQKRESSIEHPSSVLRHPSSFPCFLLKFQCSTFDVECSHPLHLSRELYKSNIFLQNKANFKNVKMIVTACNINTYDNLIVFFRLKNKAKQSQFKANFSSKLALFFSKLASVSQKFAVKWRKIVLYLPALRLVRRSLGEGGSPKGEEGWLTNKGIEI